MISPIHCQLGHVTYLGKEHLSKRDTAPIMSRSFKCEYVVQPGLCAFALCGEEIKSQTLLPGSQNKVQS